MTEAATLALCAAVLAAGRELLADRRDAAAVALALELWPGAVILRIVDKRPV